MAAIWRIMRHSDAGMSGVFAAEAAEVSLFYNATPLVRSGAQVCLGFNDSEKVSWVQVALVNRAKSSKVQVGLLNFNDNGFLPFFPLFNLDKSFFN